ncbi:NAD(P)/FAD-dependent oxidoreductase [Pontibacillus litoralis]|uniref:Pyridine nucleotide-disulfide oxidoreductase n=1 Tax=Pontibacillus litoralis JSM 072002 TaxID=1385512 RepID=A0A0A5HSK5_9BACI|nr:NAD(P)/FAD-dependent oxidoreductase [Pontibacillus litoralis]KGX86612.1 pyridine nucleotide-disulfide oxidoreductase [Pontibacillus litoralis JSM 072002]
MKAKVYDVVIVGGGPAGLSAALVLGRALREVIVIDEGSPRNKVAAQSHGFLSRDGVCANELRSIAAQELTPYKTVTYLKGVVCDVKRGDDCFQTTTLSNQTYESKKVIVATGMKDQLPTIPGLEHVYGKSVFPCPYCDGWEHREKPLALFTTGNQALFYTKLIYNWSKDIIVFTNGDMNMDEVSRKELQLHQIQFVENTIQQLQSNEGTLQRVVMNNGETYERTGGLLQPIYTKQALTISVRTSDNGGYVTNHHGLTHIQGLYVIGDARHVFTSLIGAASEGYEAGVVIHHELVEDDWNQK